MNPTDQATPLTQEAEALLTYFDDDVLVLIDREDVTDRLRAIEAAAARRAIEGSGVVEALRDCRSALASEHGHDGDAFAPWPSCLPVHIAAAILAAILAAIPRPEEPRVERCAELREKARLLSQWADAVDFMPDELRAELRDLCPRCVVCGMFESWHTPPERLANIGHDPHPFTPEAR